MSNRTVWENYYLQLLSNAFGLEETCVCYSIFQGACQHDDEEFVASLSACIVLQA